MFTLNTILYPTDFSKPSEYAFQFACLGWVCSSF